MHQNGQHLYLFTLEVDPLAVGKIYNPLPSHLTLMSRFWSELRPKELTKLVRPLFQRTKPMKLAFGKAATLGPKQVAVHLIEPTKELTHLHMQLLSTLNGIGVTYTSPRFVGDGHKPHVSRREGDQFTIGYGQTTKAAYLIEVKIQGEEHQRFIRAKFDLED